MSGRTSYNQSPHDGGTYPRIMSRENNGIPAPPSPPPPPRPSHHRYVNRFSTIVLPSTSSSSSPGGHATQHAGGQAIDNPWPPYSYEDREGQPVLPFRRVPISTHSNVQVFELDNDLGRRTYRRRQPRLPPFPRHDGFSRNNPVPVVSSEESKLTPQEQKKALSMLRKETYNPLLRNPMSSKSNYQARDWAILSRQTELENDNEHGKRCAICLEDFRIKEVVTLTPCNHMFHDDCIVPWVESHGLCPVCRYAIVKPGKERREAATTAGNSQSDNHATTLVRGSPMYEIPEYVFGPRNSLTFMSGRINDGLLDREVISVVRAMEAAFGWDVVRPSSN